MALVETSEVGRRGSADIDALTMETVERLLTPVEAARVLGLSAKTLGVLRCKGGGPRFVPVSYRVVRYRHSALMEWAKAREAGSTHEVRHRG